MDKKCTRCQCLAYCKKDEKKNPIDKQYCEEYKVSKQWQKVIKGDVL